MVRPAGRARGPRGHCLANTVVQRATREGNAGQGSGQGGRLQGRAWAGRVLKFPTHSLTPAPAGQSKPFPPKVLRKHMAWLTSEQAMADYATLIWELKEELQDPDVPVIGFGG